MNFVGAIVGRKTSDLAVIVPTERVRGADTSDRVSTIRDHLSTIETPLRSRGACVV